MGLNLLLSLEPVGNSRVQQQGGAYILFSIIHETVNTDWSAVITTTTHTSIVLFLSKSACLSWSVRLFFKILLLNFVMKVSKKHINSLILNFSSKDNSTQVNCKMII